MPLFTSCKISLMSSECISKSFSSIYPTDKFLQLIKIASDYTVHNKFAFRNYTDGEHGGIKNNNIAGLMLSQTL